MKGLFLKKLVVFQLHVGVMRNLEDMVALEMVRIWVHFLENWCIVIEEVQEGPC